MRSATMGYNPECKLALKTIRSKQLFQGCYAKPVGFSGAAGYSLDYKSAA